MLYLMTFGAGLFVGVACGVVGMVAWFGRPLPGEDQFLVDWQKCLEINNERGVSIMPNLGSPGRSVSRP